MLLFYYHIKCNKQLKQKKSISNSSNPIIFIQICIKLYCYNVPLNFNQLYVTVAHLTSELTSIFIRMP